MLVAVVQEPGGKQQRFPGFHTMESTSGGVLHVKDHKSFHHLWAPNDWVKAWSEEEGDPDE